MENNRTSFSQKILFKKQILKIKNKKINKYFLSLFSLKVIILKLVFFLILSILIFSSSFGIREYFIQYNPEGIVLNPGIAFSQLNNANLTTVYIVQSIPVVVAFIAIIFVRNPFICFGLMMLFFGGLCNVIDRSLDGVIINNQDLKNCVIDYIPVGKTMANLPDIYIITGAIIAGLLSFIEVIKIIKNNDEIQ